MNQLSVSDITTPCKPVKVLSPSSVRCPVTRHTFRYDPYRVRLLTSPVKITPATIVMTNIATHHMSPRKAISPSVKKTAALKLAAQRISTQQHQPQKIVVPQQRGVPITSVPAPQVTHFAVVRFKREAAMYIAPFRIAVGDWVVVEGDRGLHLGKVDRITTDEPATEVTLKVMRRASPSDLDVFAEQRKHEEVALTSAKKLALTLRLNHATVTDAEYQFDGQKLTIYVSRPSNETFVDFRKLQRGLFKEFRCRIWCAYLDELPIVE